MIQVELLKWSGGTGVCDESVRGWLVSTLKSTLKSTPADLLTC